MNRPVKLAFAATSTAMLFVAVPATAQPTPLGTVQTAVSQVLVVLSNPALEGERNLARRRAEIRRIAEKLFDFQEMARRVLGPLWAERTPTERAEFVALFTALLEQSYIGTITNYSGERITYQGEVVRENLATVRSKIVTTRRAEIAVDYRMHPGPTGWAVFDVVLEGVSLVSNYRTQFNRIVRSTSFEDLMDRMRTGEVAALSVRPGAFKP